MGVVILIGYACIGQLLQDILEIENWVGAYQLEMLATKRQEWTVKNMRKVQTNVTKYNSCKYEKV